MKTTNIFYRTVCLIVMALCSVCGMAQSEFGKVSPQTADFIRQGNIPVSLYTGQVSVSIPLYHIKDRDFDIPIALNYSGDGLKPNRRHGWAGLNWSVSGVGAVSREIYGAPDDHSEWYASYPDIENTSSPAMATMGYYRASQTKAYDPDSLYAFNIPLNCDDSGCDLAYVNGCFYDCNPDLFMFSMPGHSGRFLIDGSRRIIENQLICPNSYKYSLTNLKAQAYDSPIQPSQITVTSSDGYVYTFGSLTDTNALEYSFTFHPTSNYDSNEGYKRPRINAWHLTKITAPNGRTAKFNYAMATEGTTSPFMKSDCPPTSAGSNTSTTTDDYSYSATRTVLLESIEIEDTSVKVEFVNGLESCRTFYNKSPRTNKYNALGYQLEGIRVKQGDTTVYTCSLGYENCNQLRFLKTVTVSDGGVYTLEYNHPTAYPEPDWEEIDTYGYWTETGDTACSLLNKVTYPTGGSTVFDYERHAHGRAVKRTATESAYTSNLVDSVGTLNSFRIKRITSIPADGESNETKEYTYLLWSDRDKDSGTLLRTRTFVYMDDYAVFQTANRNDEYNVEDPIIGYTSVQERYDNGSYVEYVFSDYAACSDDLQTNFHWSTSAGRSTGIELAFSNASLLNSRWDQRGVLVTRRTYDSSEKLKQLVRYCYRQLGATIQPADMFLQADSSLYTTVMYPVPGGIMAMKVQMQEYPLIQEETIDYNDNGSTTRLKRFFRNIKNFVSKLEETTSARDTLKTHYTYPYEMDLAPMGIYDLLLKNTIDEPIKAIRELNSTPLDTRRTVLKPLDNGDIRVDTVYVRKGNGTERMEVCYPVYDTYSNPVHIVYGNGTEEVLVWGYAGRYPVARIEGASYNEVKAALGTAPENITDNGLYMDMLNALRTSLPDAHVTTYAYSPLVGVTAVTAPNGERTTYTYDSRKRLYQVKDPDGNVVEQYDYNYQQ